MTAVVPCPHCIRGTYEGTNGQRWRCGTCGGSGQVPAPVKPVKA